MLQYGIFPSSAVFSEVRYLNVVNGAYETRGVYLAIESVSRAVRELDDSVYLLMRRVR